MKQDVAGRTSCDEEAGRIVPMVDTHRCENKGKCVEACPYDVFAIRPLTADERHALPWLVRVKVWAHGGKQAFVVRPEACHACALCVIACPEHAITLRSATAGA